MIFSLTLGQLSACGATRFHVTPRNHRGMRGVRGVGRKAHAASEQAMIQVRRNNLAVPTDAVRSQPLKYAAALRLIEAACRLGTFASAARELGVSHTAITAAVDRVENALGQSLFTRGPRGMEPSPAALDLAQAFRTAERLVGRAWARGRTEAIPPSLGVAMPAEVGVGWLG